MATLFFILAVLLGIVAYKCYDKANRIENGFDDFHSQSKTVSSGQQEVSHNSIEVKDFRPSDSIRGCLKTIVNRSEFTERYDHGSDHQHLVD